MTLHYGIIGCGMMGHEHLSNIALLDDVEVSVIYEPNASMAVSAAKRTPRAVFADSLEALLAHQPLDAIVIASPNHCHIDQLEQIANKTSLPILVEKPLFTAPEDLGRIQAFEASYSAPVWVAMEYRYMPPMAAFLERRHDVTGGIKMLTVQEHRFPFLPKVDHWNRFNANSGGTLVEKCCHFFDLMRLILNADPTAVMASAGQSVNHLDECYGGMVPDIWDNGYVIVDFEGGARAMLELSMFAEGAEYQEEIHAIGPKGKIEVKIPGPARLWSGPPEAQPIPHVIESPRFPCNPLRRDVEIDANILAAGDHNGSTYYQHLKFREVVRGTGTVDVTLSDGIWAVRMGQAAQQSAATGQVVQLQI